MASYVKIWTDIRNSESFVSLSGIGRGVWLQLLIKCKSDGDSGQILFKSWSGLAQELSVSRPTLTRVVQKLVNLRSISVQKTDTGSICIEVLNYNKHQRVRTPRDRKEVVKNEQQVVKTNSTNKIKQDKIRQDKVVVANSDHKKAVEYFCLKHEEYYEIKYKFSGGKDGKLVKELLSHFQLGGFIALVDALFVSDDKFYDEMAGRTIGVLSANSNKLAQSIKREQDPTSKLSETEKNMLKLIQGDIDEE